MEPGLAARPLNGGRTIDAAEEDRLLGEVRPALLRWALVLGADPDAADDLVQETLFAAHRNLGRFDPSRGTFAGWTAEILVRRLRNRRRAWWRRLRLFEAVAAATPRVEPTPAAAVEARLTLQRLLQSITERQREVVALYEIADLSADETARVLGLTPAGVRSIARDARARLSEAARVPASKEERS